MQEAYSHREGAGAGLKSGNYRKTERRRKKEHKQVREKIRVHAQGREKGRKNPITPVFILQFRET
jgi:hypothetical protein